MAESGHRERLVPVATYWEVLRRTPVRQRFLNIDSIWSPCVPRRSGAHDPWLLLEERKDGRLMDFMTSHDPWPEMQTVGKAFLPQSFPKVLDLYSL